MWQLKSRWCGLSLLWIVLQGTVQAASPADEELRQRFLSAEKSIHKASAAQAEKILKDLHQYPLKPYIEVEYLSRALGNTPAIEQFLARNRGTPLEWTLKKRWLLYLAKAQLTQPYLKNYTKGTDTVMDCYALQLRLLNEKPSAVWPDVTHLWTVGESQPKECDPLFKQWQKAGQRTPEVIWARLVKAADGGDPKIIPYLRTLLPANLQYLGDKWRQVIDNPALVARSNFLPGKHRWEQEILTYALQKLVWKRADLALSVFQKYEKDPHFTKAQQIVVARQFAIALASKDDARAGKYLAIVPVQFKDDLFLQWQVAWHLRAGQWSALLKVFNELPADKLKVDSWQYWQARAMLETGQLDAGMQLLSKLANERSYYGFMAAARLGQAPNLSHKPVPVTAEQYQQFKQSAAIKRMYEWQAIGRPNAARRELNYLQKYGPEHQKLSAAKLAFDSGWYDRAIFALADAGYWDDVDIRFPLVYNTEIQKYAKAANVDPAWAMAITRRESTFIANAKSPVGAHGLMQIMPQTARHITGRRVSVELLYTPSVNIDMGTDYLNYLLKANKNNLVFATASYNAGYGRVKGWLPKNGLMPIDIWIETIPFKETREYVKAVLAYYQIYNVRMKQTKDVFKPLTEMQVGQAS